MTATVLQHIFIGHYLPLVFSLWAVWSLRSRLSLDDAFKIIGGLGVAFSLFLLSSSNVVEIKGHIIHFGTVIPLAIATPLAAMLALYNRTRLPMRAVFAATFFPLLAVDWVRSIQLLTFPANMTAIGGAGWKDGLIWTPAFAVATYALVRVGAAVTRLIIDVRKGYVGDADKYKPAGYVCQGEYFFDSSELAPVLLDFVHRYEDGAPMCGGGYVHRKDGYLLSTEESVRRRRDMGEAWFSQAYDYYDGKSLLALVTANAKKLGIK